MPARRSARRVSPGSLVSVATRKSQRSPQSSSSCVLRSSSELAEPAGEQLALFNDDERDQLQRNSDFLLARAEEIPAEIERETESLRRRFADPEPRVFPVAVEFLVPRGVDAE